MLGYRILSCSILQLVSGDASCLAADTQAMMQGLPDHICRGIEGFRMIQMLMVTNQTTRRATMMKHGDN